MSEDVLLYAARISGLMAWILAFGALAAGLLARSTPDRRTSAGIWAADTRDLLGRASVLAIVVHGTSIAAAERFDLTPSAVLIGRGSAGWLAASLLVGTICAWATVAVELARVAVRRLPVATELAVLTVAAAVVLGGAYHGWELGSDTRNPLAVAVVIVCAVLLLGAAAIGFTTLMAPAPGDAQTVANARQVPRQDHDRASNETGTSDDLFQGRSGVPADETPGLRQEQQDRPNSDNSIAPNSADNRTAIDRDEPGSLSLSRRVEPPGRPAVRGPEIASARDITVPQDTDQENADQQRPDMDDQSAWTMRKLPEAPQPQHRKRPRR